MLNFPQNPYKNSEIKNLPKKQFLNLEKYQKIINPTSHPTVHDKNPISISKNAIKIEKLKNQLYS